MSWLGRIFGIMLKRLHLKNFTVFADADFEFGPGLNVLVGTNGTGKSHVLKVGYVVESIAETSKKASWKGSDNNKLNWIIGVQATLNETFLADKLHNLIRRESNIKRADVQASFGSEASVKNGELDFSILYSDDAIASCSIEEAPAALGEDFATPVFLPAKEILSFFPGFNSILRKYDLKFDRTFINLSFALGLPALRTPPSIIKERLEPVMQGKLLLEGSEFYLQPEYGNPIEINLVAEGIRKLGMLAQLLNNGSLTAQTTLFWDEPEANLNPALLRQLAAILAELARQKFQIILATHSTDLLKEFHILSRQKDAAPLPVKYFGLNARPGEATTVVTTDNFEYLPDVVALEVELEQADNLDEIFAREDRERHANL